MTIQLSLKDGFPTYKIAKELIQSINKIKSKGTNEPHDGFIRRFTPKEKHISDYSYYDISFRENWMNPLPRRIQKYRTPDKLFFLNHKTSLENLIYFNHQRLLQ